MTKDDARITELSAGIVEFLLDGIGSDCQRFRDGCSRALQSLGCDVIDDLRDIIRHADLTPGHARRLATLIESLVDAPCTTANPIPGLLRSLMAMVATSFDEDEIIRAVGRVAEILGRHTVVNVLMDQLCDHFHDRGYAIRLINAIASVRDALASRHLDYLLQIMIYGASEIEWRCNKLLDWILELDLDGEGLTHEDSDAGCYGLKLLDWLTRASVVGPDTRVTDPEWIWLRDFRYRPMMVNHGPVLAGSL